MSDEIVSLNRKNADFTELTAEQLAEVVGGGALDNCTGGFNCSGTFACNGEFTCAGGFGTQIE